jgi:hypothetical protein
MSQWTTSYSDLITRLERFCAHDSAEFVAELPGIINRAELRCLRDLDLDFFDPAAQTGNITVGNASVNITVTDYVKVRRLQLTASGTFLIPRSMDYLEAYGGSGTPKYYCQRESSVAIAPTADGTYAYRLTCSGRPAKLVQTSNETNWLALNVADLLLAAALIESERFLKAPEQVKEYQEDYATALAGYLREFRDRKRAEFTQLEALPGAEA